MKISFLPLTKLVILTVAGICVTSLLMPKPSLAQSRVNDPQNIDPLNSSDPLSINNTEQNPFSLFQLIHNANFGSVNPDFSREQNQQLDTAALDFKKRQQMLLQGKQQPINPSVGVAPVIRPPVITPQSGK
ncbi:hypothetical protein OGM63_18060 [Plectonema radiosum NIES-515]|jgi:hypothetical protein|uniref:Uncharacterized protein n=1 Tax=Plectonema radiosum NIES-515 TaxID=2986073 RepID=A0ABT3B2D1_9CYAN|nr:hypothetical protein [Plectonema radiosum]MCV3215395.1 hypothetical protein [Plectonema radiosum NIES-515]